jgi:hypothetical protein
MRYPILPLAAGAIFAAMSTAKALPIVSGSFLTGLTASQAQTVATETRATTPDADIIQSYDIGFGTYTVQVVPKGPTNNGGSSEGGSGSGE